MDKKVNVKVVGSVKRDELNKKIEETVKEGDVIYTDENLGYAGLSNKGYRHERVHHGVGEYIKEQANTNGVESFWSMWIYGSLS